VKAEIAQHLIALNRKFYTDFGEAFSATRRRIQPGVRRILNSLDEDETILDLGCGNGELARALARDGHRGAYLGLDFSLPLLADAESVPEGFAAEFREADLTKLSAISSQLSAIRPWLLITSLLHFIIFHRRRYALMFSKLSTNYLLTVGGLFTQTGNS